MSTTRVIDHSLSYAEFIKERSVEDLKKDAEILMGSDGKGIKFGERLGFVKNVPEIYSNTLGVDVQNLSRWGWSKFSKDERVTKGIEVSEMAKLWAEQYVAKVEKNNKVEAIVATSFENLKKSYRKLANQAARHNDESLRGERHEIVDNFAEAARLIRRDEEENDKEREQRLDGVMFGHTPNKDIFF